VFERVASGLAKRLSATFEEAPVDRLMADVIRADGTFRLPEMGRFLAFFYLKNDHFLL
jgi:hypothetical protein